MKGTAPLEQAASGVRKSLAAGEVRVLTRLARREPLRMILEDIVGLIERVSDGGTGSILLVDGERRLRHGAAPGLPKAYMDAIDGQPIGPTAGSCGAAAFLNEPVYAEDIASHPNWEPYRELALPNGLRACWSTPIVDSHGEVVGTFAVYHGEPHLPGPQELEGVAIATALAALAIESWRNERALRNSRQRYRQMLDAVGDPVFQVEVEEGGTFRFSAINPAFTQVTGLTEEQVVGKEVREVLPPDSYPRVEREYRKAIATKKPIRWSEVSAYPAGKKVGEVHVAPIFDDEGRCTHLVGAVHDVTLHAELNSLMDEARCAIVTADRDGRIRRWNGGAEALYGHPSEAVVGRPLAEVLGGEPVDADALARRGMVTSVRERRTASGRTLTVESWTSWVVDSLLLVEVDVTEQNQLAAKLARAERLAAQGRLAAGMAHDFNSILTAILVNAELLGEEPLSEAARESVGDIIAAAQGATKLSQRALSLNVDDAGQQETDLVQPVRKALRTLEATRPPDVAIHLSLDSDLPKAVADPTDVQQVALNLVANAIFAVQGRGTVEVSLESRRLDEPSAFAVGHLDPGEYVVLSVTDDGAGIPADLVANVFEPYVTTKGDGGTGLGLAIVRRCAIGHDGAVDVQSEVGRGTRFEVWLPAAPRPAN